MAMPPPSALTALTASLPIGSKRACYRQPDLQANDAGSSAQPGQVLSVMIAHDKRFSVAEQPSGILVARSQAPQQVVELFQACIFNAEPALAAFAGMQRDPAPRVTAPPAGAARRGRSFSFP
jgi:hypothetical protein